MSNRSVKFFSILMAILISGCAPPAEHELNRYASLDHKVDAVIVSADTNTTVATPTKIYIVSTGANFNNQKPILIADNFKIKSIIWKNQQKLIIDFYDGRIFSYQNFWSSKDVDNFTYNVRVYLIDANTPK